jgi:flagellar basal body rod protein FlgB
MEAPISTLKLASAMARHAAHSHSAVTSNLARADIPGAERVQMQSFEEMVRSGQPTPTARATGEAISVEREMLDLAEAGSGHDAALTLWKSTLNRLRMAVAAPR